MIRFQMLEGTSAFVKHMRGKTRFAELFVNERGEAPVVFNDRNNGFLFCVHKAEGYRLNGGVKMFYKKFGHTDKCKSKL